MERVPTPLSTLVYHPEWTELPNGPQPGHSLTGNLRLRVKVGGARQRAG